MHRLFLDANVLFSAAYKATRLRTLWENDQQLLTSNYAVQEARRNIHAVRPDALDMLEVLLKPIKLTAEGNIRDIPANITLPKKDQPILAAAIQAQATHLLTGDVKHFGAYFGQVINNVLILAPAQYFDHIQIKDK